MTSPDIKPVSIDLSHSELLSLLELGEKLVSELDMEKVLMLVANAACQVVHAETLVVPIIDTEKQTFTYRAATGKYAEIVLCQTFPIHEGTCGWVMKHKRPLLFGEDSDFDIDSSAVWQPGLASNLLVPLICRGVIIGGLSAMGKMGGGAFTQRDLKVLTLFANQASVAIDNARLFQSLGEEEARLRLVLDSVAEAIYGIDLNGQCTLVNPACLTMLGYENESELLGKDMHAAMHHSHADGSSFPLAECAIHKTVLNGITAHSDLEFFWRKDGTSFPIEYWAHPKRINGEVVGAVVTFVDITERKLAESVLNSTAKMLRESKNLLEAIVEHIPVMVFVKRADDLCFELFNRAGEELLGYSRKDLLGKGNYDFWPKEQGDLFTAADRKVLASKEVTEIPEEFISTASGEIRTLHTWKVGLFDESGKPLHLLGISVDITESKKAEERLAESEKKLRGLFELSPLGIALTNDNGGYVEFNEAFRQICGYSAEELKTLNYETLTPKKYEADDARQIESLEQTGHYGPYEKEYVRKDGRHIPIELSGMLLHGNGGQKNVWSIVQDISERKQYEARLEHVANYDALTNLPNRFLLADRMRQAISQTMRDKHMMAVCYLDLDGFKPVNDELGHEAGDGVLIEIAKRIENAIRGGDTVARLGGDEFVILLLGQEKGEESVLTIERVLTAISQPITIESTSVQISASIGVSFYPLDDEDPDTLLRHADQAMYKAKQSGKNRFYIYDPELDRATRGQNEFLNSVRYGLDNHQFELYYQPKVNLKSNELVGAEALIRWRHPERGLLSPGEFLNQIENTEIDIKLGEWVTSTALAQMTHWQKEGLDIEISVNISGYHLESDGFVEKLMQQLLAHSEISSGKLQIEVLETVAINDITTVQEIIAACRKLGVGFALDDFGTGYSSLIYLSRLPVDTLKIDQTFIRDMLVDKGDMAIVHGIIALAKVFERTTVAEGIETKEHFQALLDMECEVGQGYGIARPMPATELISWRDSYASCK